MVGAYEPRRRRNSADRQSWRVAELTAGATAIRAIHTHDTARRITASIGIAVLPDDAGDAENVVRAADRALYAAKNNGRDRIETVKASAGAQRAFMHAAAG